MNKKKIIMLLFIFMLFFVSQVVMAKYLGTVSDSASLYEIAKPIMVLDVHSFSDEVSPLDDVEIDFDVKNFNTTATNEVKLKYTISLNVDNGLPLGFSLYDSNDNPIALDSNLKTTSSFYMPASTNTTHSYKLVVSWNGSTSHVYQNLSNDLNIEINVEQTEIQ